MLKEILFNREPYVLLEKMLDRAALKQSVISSNIAHVNTPGYKRLGVSFNKEFRKAVNQEMNIKHSDSAHFYNSNPFETIEPEVALVNDNFSNGVNNVNIEQEMVDLAKNQLDFDTAARLMNIRFSQLRTAIRGRR